MQYMRSIILINKQMFSFLKTHLNKTVKWNHVYVQWLFSPHYSEPVWWSDRRPFHFAIATFEAILEGLISVSCLMVMVSFILASRTGLMCVSLLLCGRTNHVG